jgi:hypothetical protein
VQRRFRNSTTDPTWAKRVLLKETTYMSTSVPMISRCCDLKNRSITLLPPSSHVDASSLHLCKVKWCGSLRSGAFWKLLKNVKAHSEAVQNDESSVRIENWWREQLFGCFVATKYTNPSCLYSYSLTSSFFINMYYECCFAAWPGCVCFLSPTQIIQIIW